MTEFTFLDKMMFMKKKKIYLKKCKLFITTFRWFGVRHCMIRHYAIENVI